MVWSEHRHSNEREAEAALSAILKSMSELPRQCIRKRIC